VRAPQQLGEPCLALEQWAAAKVFTVEGIEGEPFRRMPRRVEVVDMRDAALSPVSPSMMAVLAGS
jgi:hypothetical protein